MTYALINPPSAEPLTLAEVKAHLRLEEDAEDSLLAGLVKVAREHLEHETGLSLMTQGWRLYRDDWPAGGVIPIGRGPVQAVESVTVYDAAGVPQPVSLADHLLDGAARPARLWLRDPRPPGRPINGIEIDFLAGFGEAATDVPDTLKRAMLLHVAHMFAFRGEVALDNQPAGVPPGYARLIAPFQRRGL